MHSVALIGFYTLVRRETVRFLRIWTQTILPPAITMSLYFVIFGHLIGSRIGEVQGIPYIQFIVPGLVMMSVLTNAYANAVASFFGAKFQRNLEEMLVSPMSSLTILSGFVMGGVLRAVLVGVLVTMVAACFTPIHLTHVSLIFAVGIMVATLFATAGVINGLFARKFDDINIVPTFILTPLSYLGGIFYSIEMLPPLGQAVTKFNPMFYMVNAFRQGFYGHSDVGIGSALTVISATTILLFALTWIMIDRGFGIRN